MALKMLQFGGIVGGVALILIVAFSSSPFPVWACLTAVSVSLMVFHGLYEPIERATLVMIALFFVFTLVMVVFLQVTPFAIHLADVSSGLVFRLPPEAVVVAIGAFGITGVGGDEIMSYNYWLLGKGYAAFTGPKDGSAGWGLPLVWATVFTYSKTQGSMVIIGGLATVFRLFLVVFSALYFRYRRLDPALRPSRISDAMLWLSSIVIGLGGCYGLVRLL